MRGKDGCFVHNSDSNKLAVVNEAGANGNVFVERSVPPRMASLTTHDTYFGNRSDRYVLLRETGGGLLTNAQAASARSQTQPTRPQAGTLSAESTVCERNLACIADGHASLFACFASHRLNSLVVDIVRRIDLRSLLVLLGNRLKSGQSPLRLELHACKRSQPIGQIPDNIITAR